MYIPAHIHTYLADLGEEALEVQDNGQGLGRVPLVQGLVRHVLLRLRQVLHAGLHLLGWWGVGVCVCVEYGGLSPDSKGGRTNS